MSDRVAVYNSDEVFITFGPVIISEIGGYGPDEFCSISPEADDATDVLGVDGEVVVSRTNDKRTDIAIKLLQSSNANDGLSVIRQAFLTAPGAVGGIWPFMVGDIKNGRALYKSMTAWIKRPPDVMYSRQATEREWTIRAAHLIRYDGGSFDAATGESATFSTIPIPDLA